MRRLLLLALLLFGCATTRPDLPHLRQVRPNVWASGQPSDVGFKQFAAVVEGKQVNVIKLNFESEGSEAQARLLGWRVLNLGIIPRTDFKGLVQAAEEVFERPDQKVWSDILHEVLRIPVSDDGRVWLIHCVNGNDRTNLVVGHIRVLIDGWGKATAFDEMVQQGFHWELVGLDRQWAALPEPTRAARASAAKKEK